MSARGPFTELRVTSAPMHRIAVLLAVLAASFAPAGVAQAQLGGPNVPTPLTEPPPPPPVQNDLDDEGLSSLQQALIFGAALLVLGVIALVIVRDARRSAPVAKHPRKATPGRPGPKSTAVSGGALTGTSASAVRARERQRAKRAKAKARAARQQRKRNRPR